MQANTMHAHKHAFVIFCVHCFGVFSCDAKQCDARQVNTAHKNAMEQRIGGRLPVFLTFLCMYFFMCFDAVQCNAISLKQECNAMEQKIGGR